MPNEMSINMESHKDEVLSAVENAMSLGLKAIGEEAEGYAKSDCPVDTGRLRASISYATADGQGSGDAPNASPEKGVVVIGTNVEYAPSVETRDISHKTGKAHFLRDAVANHGDHYKAIMEAAMKST